MLSRWYTVRTRHIFHNAFSAAKVMSQENFKPLSTEDKDTLLAYLKNVQYRLKRNNERSSGMSKIADTYWIYITTFKIAARVTRGFIFHSQKI